MQAPEKRPVAIIADTDIGNDAGDALALAVLYGMEGKDEVRIAALNVSKPNLKAAALCEVISRFYAGAVSGAFAAFRRPLPVGLAETGPSPESTPLLEAVLGKKNTGGKLVYEHGIEKITDTAESRALLRNALTAQQDGNAIVVLLGPATSLAGMLALPDAKDWVKRKVRFLAMSATRENIDADRAAAAKIFAEWPSPIVVAEDDLDVRYPWSSIEKDFAWNENHPVADAVRAAAKQPGDVPALDIAVMLYAGRPDAGYFTLVDVDGGKRRKLTATPEQKQRIAEACIGLASAKPVVRERRRRRPEADPPKPEPKAGQKKS